MTGNLFLKQSTYLIRSITQYDSLSKYHHAPRLLRHRDSSGIPPTF